MRHLIHLLYGLMLLPFLVACTHEDVQYSLPSEPGPCTYRMTLSASFRNYDHASTRANVYGFRQGDKVYVLFQQSKATITGTAVYDAANDTWVITASQALAETDDGSCRLAFFLDAGTATQNEVTLTQQTRIYTDIEATYQFIDGLLNVQATLSPALGRIRFHGEVGQKCMVSGLSFANRFDLTTHTFTLSPSNFTATCQADGYTDYYYAAFSDPDKRELTVDSGDEDYIFLKTFDSSVLVPGKSGFLDIPTMTNSNGWQLIKYEKDPLGLCPNNQHPHAIDMGDGLKWSCCNLGAKTPIDYGDYYAWGETTTKSTYNWSTYKWCKGSETTMTKYCNSSQYGTVDNKTTLELTDDAARVNWGSPWRMPTFDEFSKLNSDCTWTWTTVGDVNGYKVTASNGNTLFLPAAGWCYDSSLKDPGFGGSYWSSSLNMSYAYGALILYFNSSAHDTNYYSYRYYGDSVRPVTE